MNPATGAAYGLDFPLLDMADFVTVHRALLAHLGVERLLAAFGGSLGGMQVLEWALTYPDDMATAVVIAASISTSATPAWSVLPIGWPRSMRISTCSR